MRYLVSTIFLLVCINTQAQIPPAIQWQKCIGGTEIDDIRSMVLTPDAGVIMAGNSYSSDGDVGNNYGSADVLVIKTDLLGNILWRKNYGGSGGDFVQSYQNIINTTDGGFIFTANTSSNDRDVIGARPGDVDIWVVKIDNAGTIQWQRSYGSHSTESSWGIRQTTDGGYVVIGTVQTNGGDVSGTHGYADLWVFKINSTGVLQWQRAFGGSLYDEYPMIIATTDGGSLIGGSVASTNGDVTCTMVNEDLWLAKLDNNGNIQWQSCLGGNYGEVPFSLLQTSDGGYLSGGLCYSTSLPGNLGLGGDGWVVKWSAAGNVEWQRFLGGTGRDEITSVQQTPDGGYIAAGTSSSVDGDICSNRGNSDFFLVKLRSNGTTEWKKTLGGSKMDNSSAVLATSDGGYLLGGYTLSNDFDVSGNHSAKSDGWLAKLSFPGLPLLPAITIRSDKITICPGEPLRFIATITDGGTAPSFQWKVNGVNAANNNDTVIINALNDGDVVSCALTSNSPCVTDPNALSNTITIRVDPSLTPTNFLFPDTTICEYGTLTLKSLNVFDTYLWNTSANTPSITVTSAGIYWLDVIKAGCPGTDSVLVTTKDCLKGLYMPTAFTPNNDGKNDVLKPTLAGNVLQYKFTVMNRWGQVVFQSSDLSKGWDGKLKGLLQNGNVYVWTCTYQLAGEGPRQAKGTFVLIR